MMEVYRPEEGCSKAVQNISAVFKKSGRKKFGLLSANIVEITKSKRVNKNLQQLSKPKLGSRLSNKESN